MKIDNEFVKTKEVKFIANSIEYLLFSFIEFSIKIGYQTDLRLVKAPNFRNFWTMGKKTSNRNFVLVFLQTSVKIYNFVKFLICVTNKFKILGFPKKSKLLLNRSFTYLTLKNNLNKNQIYQKFKKREKTKALLFNTPENLTTDSYLFIESRKNKFDYKFINIFDNNRKYFSFLNQFTKIKSLNFDIAIKNIRLHLFLNSFKFKLEKSLDLFIEFKNYIKTKSYFKTLIIIDDLTSFYNFHLNNIANNFSSISHSSSLRYNLNVIKKFNSNKVNVLIIEEKIWKKNNLFNRIDPRTLTVLFKIKFESNKKHLTVIKSFFYF